jgi:hypothetical protein
MDLFIMERSYGAMKFVVYRAKILLNAVKGGELRGGGMWSVYKVSEVE